MSAEPAKLSAADEAASLVQPDPSTKVYQRQKKQSFYSSLIESHHFLNALLTIHKAYRVGGFSLTQYSHIFELIEQTACLLCQIQAALSIVHVLQVTKYHHGFFLTTINIYLSSHQVLLYSN